VAVARGRLGGAAAGALPQVAGFFGAGFPLLIGGLLLFRHPLGRPAGGGGAADAGHRFQPVPGRRQRRHPPVYERVALAEWSNAPEHLEFNFKKKNRKAKYNCICIF